MHTTATQKDMSLFYYGGSGGFLLLHLLLMSGKFYAGGINIDKLEQQWNITDPRDWKSQETWPKNLETEKSVTSKTKLYFNCNNPDQWINKDQTRVLIYVDLDMQLKLSQYKNAWCYNNKVLSQEQTDELLEKINTTAIAIGNKRYYYKLPELIEKADIKINLLDLVLSPKNELAKFGLELNSRQTQLIQHWISLHNGIIGLS